MHPTSTKIIATLGPATRNIHTIRKLIAAGVDIFRLNFSHGTHTDHAAAINAVRQAAIEVSSPVAIMQDLQGPRIRTGKLSGKKQIHLKEGSQITLRAGDFEGNENLLGVNYEKLALELHGNSRILIADGMIELTVNEINGDDILCTIVSGGTIGENKGINLPGAKLSVSAPTEKDIEDLTFGLEQGIDFVALSFVGAAEDLNRLKLFIKKQGASVPVISKIERIEALEHIDDIIKASDGVMVARGDLGIEIPTESVPIVQKEIIRKANSLAVPVITATQMLESMIKSSRPTRAEATDVANAIIDGTDAVMLSGETSIGKHPVQAVSVMDRISRSAEAFFSGHTQVKIDHEALSDHIRQIALARAVNIIVEEIQAKAIVVFTITGATAGFISQQRPPVPVYALTPLAETFRKLSLVWGVQPVLFDMFDNTDIMIQHAGMKMIESGKISDGDTVIYVAGAATSTPGGVDMLKIHTF